jgi:hypothetical protein
MYTCLYAWHVSAKKNKSIFRGWSILSCEKITFASETILLFQKLWIPIPPRSPRSRGSILLSMRKIWFRQRATYSDMVDPTTNIPQFRTDGAVHTRRRRNEPKVFFRQTSNSFSFYSVLRFHSSFYTLLIQLFVDPTSESFESVFRPEKEIFCQKSLQNKL